MRVHGGAMILHGGLMGASWGPHEGLMRFDRGFMGALSDSHGASWPLWVRHGGLMKANKQIFR